MQNAIFSPSEIPAQEQALVAALRRGDEASFMELVDRYNASMVRIAMTYVGEVGIAEEVVQDAWLGVLTGLERFEGRSSLKTWVFRILTYRAISRAQREKRSVPFSDLETEVDDEEPALEADRFLPADHPSWPHHWAVPPQAWDQNIEDHLLIQEAMTCIREAIAALPPSQRVVINVRDVEGWSSEEVCNVFGLSETNQRVLLHRARARVRAELERYFVSGMET